MTPGDHIKLLFAIFSAAENAQHDETPPIEAVLKNIGRIENTHQ